MGVTTSVRPVPTRTTGSAGAWAAGIALWAFLGVLAPIIGADDPLHTLGSVPGMLAFLVIQVATVQLARLVIAGRARYLAMGFWLFSGIWLGLAGFLQVDRDVWQRRVSYVGTPYTDHMLTTALVVVLVGCAAYQIGEWFARGRPVPSIGQHRVLSIRRLRWMAVGAVTISVMAVAAGGLSLLTTREEVANLTSGPWMRAARVLTFAAAFLVVYAFRHGRVRSWSTLQFPSKVLFVATVAGSLIISNPLVVQRAGAAAVYGGLALVAVGDSRWRWTPRIVVIALVAGTLVVFPFLNNFRQEESRVEYSERIEGGLLGPLTETTGDFGSFAQLVDGVDYVDRHGHTNGQHLLATAFVFIPRSVWESKSVNLGDAVHDRLGYAEHFTWGSTMWMEFFVEGGWLLVLLGFALYGYVSARLDHAYLSRAPGVLPILVPALAAYQIYLLRGSSQAVAPQLGLLVLILIASTVRCRSTSPRPSR